MLVSSSSNARLRLVPHNMKLFRLEGIFEEINDSNAAYMVVHNQEEAF